jgi:hypothetical protein
MELPDDVLGLVREFSKPCRYWHEYKEVLVELTLYRWPELKKKLSETIGPVKLFLEKKRAFHYAKVKYPNDDRWTLSQEKQKAYKDLLFAVYGEQPDFRWSWPYEITAWRS